MKFKLDMFIHLKIKNYIKSQKLFFFCFFNTKKQKVNLKILQQLSVQNLKIIKFKNIYFQNLLKQSIFNNLIHICSNHLHICNSVSSSFINNIQKNIFKIFNNVTIFSILFENFIYNKAQIKNIISLKLMFNITTFYLFLFKIFVSIFKLFINLKSK
jgi:hypothetical protein